MKKLKLLFPLALVIILTYLAIASVPQSETNINYASNQSISEVNKTNLHQTVYVCTGGFAKRYHSTPNCRGLNNCKGDIVEMSVEKATQKGKTPCKICY